MLLNLIWSFSPGSGLVSIQAMNFSNQTKFRAFLKYWYIFVEYLYVVEKRLNGSGIFEIKKIILKFSEIL